MNESNNEQPDDGKLAESLGEAESFDTFPVEPAEEETAELAPTQEEPFSLPEEKNTKPYFRVNAQGHPVQFLYLEEPEEGCYPAPPDLVEILLDSPHMFEDYTLQEDGTFRHSDAFAPKPWDNVEPVALHRSGSPVDADVVFSAGHLKWRGPSGKINVTLVDSLNLPVVTVELSPNVPVPVSVQGFVDAYWFPVTMGDEATIRSNWPETAPQLFHQVRDF